MASADQIRRRALVAVAGAGVVAAVAGCGAKAPAERDGAGKISKAGAENLLKLRAGDCASDMRKQLIDEPTSLNNGVPTVNALPCSALHDAEILLVAGLGDGGWPGSSIVDGEAARGRETLRARLSRLQAANPGSRLTLISFRPTQDRWEFEHQHQIVFAVLYAQPQRGAAAK
jgi:hypothetical protein